MILVTGPARSLVGGQSRHLDRLAMIATSLGCSLEHIEIGRRAGESRVGGTALRLWRDYQQVVIRLRQARRARGVAPSLSIDDDAKSRGAGVALAAARRSEPLVLHVNSSVQYASLLRDIGFVVIGRLLGADLVVAQIHGCELDGPQDRRAPLRWLARLLAAVADRLVVLGRSQALAIGGAAAAALVVPNAVVLQEPVARSLRNGRPRELRVLYLARLIPEKGPLRCLEAVDLLRQRGVPLRLTIAGEGPLLQELRARVQASGLDATVSVKGAVPPAQVRALLAAHDLLWAPSMYAEGQPYALLEALEAGLPALTCVPNAAMRELLDDCAGALVAVAPDAQALARATAALAVDPAELQRLQRLARQTAERRFAIEAVLPLWRAGWSLPPAAPLQPDPCIRTSS